jgi:hypothetical protein
MICDIVRSKDLNGCLVNIQSGEVAYLCYHFGSRSGEVQIRADLSPLIKDYGELGQTGNVLRKLMNIGHRIECCDKSSHSRQEIELLEHEAEDLHL